MKRLFRKKCQRKIVLLQLLEYLCVQIFFWLDFQFTSFHLAFINAHHTVAPYLSIHVVLVNVSTQKISFKRNQWGGKYKTNFRIPLRIFDTCRIASRRRFNLGTDFVPIRFIHELELFKHREEVGYSKMLSHTLELPYNGVRAKCSIVRKQKTDCEKGDSKGRRQLGALHDDVMRMFDEAERLASG